MYISKIVSRIFGASGTGHAAGLVPDPGSTAGTTQYLREDATWATPSFDMLSTLGQSEVVISGTANLSVGRMHVCAGSSAYTVTMPNPVGNTGKFVGVRITNTNLVTVTHFSTEGIDGQASRIMWRYESAIMMSDGANWYKVAGKSIPMACTMTRNASFNVTYNAVYFILFDTSVVDNTALMADTTVNNRIKILRTSNYLMSAGVGMNPITNSSNTQIVAYTGGTPIVASTITGTVSTAIALVMQTAGSGSASAGDYFAAYAQQTQASTAAAAGITGGSTFISVVEVPQW